MDMLERPVVIVPAADWQAFQAWADRPAERIAALEDLARTDTAWREGVRPAIPHPAPSRSSA